MVLAARHYVLLGAVAIGSGASGALVTWLVELPPSAEYEAAEPVAEALVESEAPVWPPRPSEAEETAASTEHAGAVSEQPAEAALPELPPDTEGFRVRSGSAYGILYLEHVIGVAEQDKPLPMILVFHGRGSRAHIAGTTFRALSHPVRVIVPQAHDTLGDGYQWLPVRVGEGLVERLSSSLFRVSSELAAFIREMTRRYPTAGRAIVTGFSQGGLLTIALAIHHDDVVGHALPIAAWLPPPLEPIYRRSDLDYPAIRAMHGTLDEIVPLRETGALFDRLRSKGFDVELVAFEGVEHDVSPPMNELFGVWLEQAVCRTLNDLACDAAAIDRERSLRNMTLDGGIADGSVADGSVYDAGDTPPAGGWPDAGFDAER